MQLLKKLLLLLCVGSSLSCDDNDYACEIQNGNWNSDYKPIDDGNGDGAFDAVVNGEAACGKHIPEYGTGTDVCIQLHKNIAYGNWYLTCYDLGYRYSCNGDDGWLVYSEDSCSDGVFSQLCKTDDDCQDGLKCVAPIWYLGEDETSTAGDELGACRPPEET